MKWVLILFLLLFTQSLYSSQHELNTEPLKVGDKAPPISVDKWLKGDSIQTFKKDKIYVVEFGFTTCTPCIAGIPHLSALANKYKEKVTVISVFVKDPPSRVEKLMDKIGNRMEYSVAIDDKYGTMDSTWVVAAGQNGYPTVFVIGEDGRFLWIGSNVKSLDGYIGNLINGEGDKPAAKESALTEEEVLHRIILNQNEGNYSIALKTVDSLIMAHPNDRKYNIMKFENLLNMDEDLAYEYGWEMLHKLDWQLNEVALYKASGFATDVPKYEKPDYDLAIAMNEKAIETCPIDLVVAHSYRTISVIHYLRGNAQKGEKMMLKAIDSLPQELEDQKEQWRKEIEIYPNTILGKGRG